MEKSLDSVLAVLGLVGSTSLGCSQARCMFRSESAGSRSLRCLSSALSMFGSQRSGP